MLLKNNRIVVKEVKAKHAIKTRNIWYTGGREYARGHLTKPFFIGQAQGTLNKTLTIGQIKNQAQNTCHKTLTDVLIGAWYKNYWIFTIVYTELFGRRAETRALLLPFVQIIQNTHNKYTITTTCILRHVIRWIYFHDVIPGLMF